MSTDAEERLRQLIQSGLGDGRAPAHLAERAVQNGRRALRRRRLGAAVAVVAAAGVIATGTALHPWTQADSRPQLLGAPPDAPPVVGPGASDSALETAAETYASARLGVQISKTLGSRRGGECAVYDLRDARGVSHRVVLILQGDLPTYEPVYLTQSFHLQQFVPDSDDACGMRSSGNLQRISTDGTEVPTGPM